MYNGIVNTYCKLYMNVCFICKLRAVVDFITKSIEQSSKETYEPFKYAKPYNSLRQ